ncbi:MAG: caspase family protein [Reyranella sp.]
MGSWAIVVGINEYPPLAKQTALQGAVADACDFADWALEPAGGNVAPQNLFFWTHPWPAVSQGRLQAYIAGGLPQWHNVDLGSAEPDRTRAPHAREITTTIESLGRTMSAQAMEDGDTETRRVYVFLAGHGIRAKTFDRSEETCFLAGDFRPINSNLAAGLIPCDSFRRALLHNRFNEAILFTDCCRKQTARSALRATPVSDYSDQQPTSPHSIAYAAQDDMPAYETLQPPVRGAFSSALMRGLRNHRIGALSDLYAAPLKQYVLENIKHFTDTDQKPNMWFHPDGDGPLIVRGPPAVAGPISTVRIIDVSALPNGTQLILNDGSDMPIPGIPPLVVVGPTIETPPLARGLYSIQVDDGSGRYTIFRHPSAEPVHVG